LVLDPLESDEDEDSVRSFDMATYGEPNYFSDTKHTQPATNLGQASASAPMAGALDHLITSSAQPARAPESPPNALRQYLVKASTSPVTNPNDTGTGDAPARSPRGLGLDSDSDDEELLNIEEDVAQGAESASSGAPRRVRFALDIEDGPRAEVRDRQPAAANARPGQV
jgi:hypothetical protein